MKADMDLRDYFAGEAMVALMPKYREYFELGVLGDDWELDVVPELAHGAYAIAKAMLQARSESYGDWLNRRDARYEGDKNETT
jgi:hypothetical protein